MMRGRRLLLFAGLFLLVTACMDGGRQSASLHTVMAETAQLILPEKGSVRLPFVVEEADYRFDLENEVYLYPVTGVTPHVKECMLTRVERDTVPGRYVAVITDAGVRRDYAVDVLLGVRNTDGTIVFSAPIRCCGDLYPTRGVIPKSGLPVLYVNTENDAPIVSKDDYLPMEFRLLETPSGTLSEPLTGSIRGRGNTTWGWPKKPYLMKLDKKASMLEMPSHKRWILLANFMDRTLMRNLVAMKVSSLTSLDWTPRCRNVELVLNGRHRGTYLLIEQVRVDKKRVNIQEMSASDNAGDAVTGGYLLELDFHYDNEVQWIDPHGQCVQLPSGIPFAVKYPDPEDLTPSQRSYIQNYVAEAAQALYGPDFRDPEKGYAAYIDVDSFIDYWIVYEVMGNHELGNPGSVYLHKDRGGKLVAGPCWDFDWGVLSYNANPQARTGLLNLHAIWYDRLFQDPDFRAKARTRFRELLPALQTIPAYIDETKAYLESSAADNFRLWDPTQDGMINGDEALRFEEAVFRLKTIYQERLAIIESQL